MWLGRESNLFLLPLQYGVLDLMYGFLALWGAGDGFDETLPRTVIRAQGRAADAEAYQLLEHASVESSLGLSAAVVFLYLVSVG